MPTLSETKIVHHSFCHNIQPDSPAHVLGYVMVPHSLLCSSSLCHGFESLHEHGRSDAQHSSLDEVVTQFPLWGPDTVVFTRSGCTWQGHDNSLGKVVTLLTTSWHNFLRKVMTLFSLQSRDTLDKVTAQLPWQGRDAVASTKSWLSSQNSRDEGVTIVSTRSRNSSQGYVDVLAIHRGR